MADYLNIPTTTQVDHASLVSSLRSSVDPTIGMFQSPTHIRLKKNTRWTSEQITAATDLVTTAKAVTRASTASSRLDTGEELVTEATSEALLSFINDVRGVLLLPPITPEMMKTAIKQNLSLKE